MSFEIPMEKIAKSSARRAKVINALQQRPVRDTRLVMTFGRACHDRREGIRPPVEESAIAARDDLGPPVRPSPATPRAVVNITKFGRLTSCPTRRTCSTSAGSAVDGASSESKSPSSRPVRRGGRPITSTARQDLALARRRAAEAAPVASSDWPRRRPKRSASRSAFERSQQTAERKRTVCRRWREAGLLRRGIRRGASLKTSGSRTGRSALCRRRAKAVASTRGPAPAKWAAALSRANGAPARRAHPSNTPSSPAAISSSLSACRGSPRRPSRSGSAPVRATNRRVKPASRIS